VKYSVTVNYPNVGPPNGSAAQAIAFARGVIGAAYSTSPRTGPTYDCSGLVMMAWRAAGVNIAGSSGSMYASLPHVPLNAVQPGDLIFYGAGGSSHVALYVGGGQIIDASSSANAVVQRAIWGSPIGAARVT
jgi:cell wall-associated NlpC family hydrolase